ncbi:MAG: SDR family oxidoreductase [Elusimicrobia bacterium]|nr:SDR family oxidoreductase [Elusimicrobiota bacterium]
MKKFDNIKVGDTAEVRHTITAEDITKFVELTGDDNKLHVDKEFAGKTAFKKPVVHGMLGASFISTVIGTKLPGDGALWFAQNLEFLLPVRVGDTITVKAKVIKKLEHHNIVEIQTDIINQNKQKVTAGVAKVKIIEPVSPEPDTKKTKPKKTALVVGGTGGIGRAVCMQLAGDGFDVIVHYNSNKELAEQLKKQIEKLGQKSMTVKTDITDASQVKDTVGQIIRKFGGISLLVNCATVKIANVKVESLDWQDIQGHMDINIKGIFNLVKNIIPVMEKEKYGHIINIVSQYIEGTPPANLLPYITAKSALQGFSKALAVETAPKGIRVNMVSPGMTDTELISDIPEKIRMVNAAKTPLRRLAKPEDVAKVIGFLASDGSDFLTGETIRINGGQIML